MLWGHTEVRNTEELSRVTRISSRIAQDTQTINKDMAEAPAGKICQAFVRQSQSLIQRPGVPQGLSHGFCGDAGALIHANSSPLSVCFCVGDKLGLTSE